MIWFTAFTGRDCLRDKRGNKYLGTSSRSNCLPWMNVTLPMPDAYFLDGSPEKAWRYCRNPDDSADGPYCLLKGGNRQSCSLYKFCGEPCSPSWVSCSCKKTAFLCLHVKVVDVVSNNPESFTSILRILNAKVSTGNIGQKIKKRNLWNNCFAWNASWTKNRHHKGIKLTLQVTPQNL